MPKTETIKHLSNIADNTNMEDTRNVMDHYKYWTEDAIRADLDQKRTDLVVIAENFASDFNIGTIIRNANAFVAKEVVILGRKKFDRRGTVGTHNYENLKHVREADDIDKLYEGLKADGYEIVVMDNVDQAVDIRNFVWPEKTALVFGQESVGVSEKSLAAADHVVYIPQFGSVRSLNVGSASAIAMYAHSK